MTQSRVVFITGGNRGIGYAIAQQFIEQGHKVAVTVRSGTGPEGSLSLKADVTDSSSLDAAIAKAEQ
jgi:3-oxoacyl-[acyl-carrier protein] reductase